MCGPAPQLIWPFVGQPHSCAESGSVKSVTPSDLGCVGFNTTSNLSCCGFATPPHSTSSSELVARLAPTQRCRRLKCCAPASSNLNLQSCHVHKMYNPLETQIETQVEDVYELSCTRTTHVSELVTEIMLVRPAHFPKSQVQFQMEMITSGIASAGICIRAEAVPHLTFPGTQAQP